MKIEIPKREQIKQSVLEPVNSCRGRVLNIVEAQLGTSDKWRIIRGQLLNVFGEKGLSGDIERAVDAVFDGGCEQ